MFDRDGLYLEVSPRGGKWWRLKYRFAGKEKRVSLGVYPEVNLKKARARTIEARQLLEAGVDPSENRRAAKAAQIEGAANSFEVVTREWIDRQMKSWVKGHGERILTRFERDLFPWIGARPIADLTAPELLTTVRRTEKRGALETAHRALGNCGQVLRYAGSETDIIERTTIPKFASSGSCSMIRSRVGRAGAAISPIFSRSNIA
jgi:hypothetical protein